MGANILLIDSDPFTFDALSMYLGLQGYTVSFAQTGEEGLAAAEKLQPDLVLLEVVLSGLDGWEVCKQLRQHSRVPIIFVTTQTTEADVLQGFFLGADDYVKKPFSFAELNARIWAVLNRAKIDFPADQSVKSEELLIDFGRKRVSVDGKVVPLTPIEYRLLEALARHANRTIPIARLLSEVWGEYCDGDEQHVKQFIWSLRKKIEENPDEPRHLINRRGFGYRFD